ncbi:hypothetical protein ACJ73_05120 [Blastomyces percursus]|uniref:Uncharacterized protein n=1 Tax=Blastomyces percursus TaxID=1658174 RepID=A0A1J9Q4C7_9EURO|nr:hypothetical protein ACJ73_05120 [Blastomyces percursus]
MLGAVVGAKLGIAKKIKPYIVRIPRRDPRGSNPTAEDYVLSLSKISDRYPHNRRTTRAILSMSWILLHGEFIQTPKCIFPFTGAGNVPSSIIEGWPTLFGANVSTLTKDELQRWLDIPEILVVGAVDAIEGRMSSNSGWDKRRHIPHVHAPGYDLWRTETRGVGLGLRITRNQGALRSLPLIQPASLLWNGAEWNGVAYCPYEWSIFQRRADDKLTDQCIAVATSTGDPTMYSSKVAAATSTDNLSHTASRTLTTPSITTYLTESPKPTDIGCTLETIDKCALSLKCGFPRRTGCLDGKCVCILPPPPPPNPPQPTNKGPTTLVTTTKNAPPAVTEKPKVPLKVTQRQCRDNDVYQGRSDITGKWVEYQAEHICDKSREIRPGESITDRKKSEGCEMAVNIVNPAEPLPGTECVNLLYENWEHRRNNAGVGGFIDVGCLRYEFIPRHPKR